MIRDYKDLAIIIRTKDFGEADRLFTLFTKENGKISVVAKGVRRIKSKLSGGLDLLNVSEIHLARGKSLDIVTGVKIVDAFTDLKSNLEKVALVYCFSELIYKITPEEEKHEEIYHLLFDSMKVLEGLQKNEEIDILKSVFEYKLLGYLGHSPRLDVCVHCKKDYNEKTYFDFEHGGVICEKCERDHSIICETITVSEIRFLNAFDKIQVKDIFKVSGIEGNTKNIEDIIKKFNYYIFSKVYKSEDFYKKLKI